MEVLRIWHCADRVIVDLDVVHDSGVEGLSEAVPAVVLSVPASKTPKLAARADRIRRLAREVDELSAELERLQWVSKLRPDSS